jgi:DNA replication and repair protein RecF
MIQSVKLVSFRNHQELEFRFDNDVVLLVGANALGKTNLLEALHVGATGSGFRSGDGDLINKQSANASLKIESSGGVRKVKLEKQIDGLSRSFFIDEQQVKSRKKFEQNLPVVLFEPEDMRMLSGSPDLRRGWLDGLLSRISPNYTKLLAGYSRALRQRNRLLKTGIRTEDQYFVWELKLSEFGNLIVEQRKILIDEINGQLTELYQKISGGNERLKVEYETPEGSYAAWLAGALRLRRDHDQRLGHTTLGPHREDFSVIRNDTPLISTGSRGEIRSAVLALKLFEVSKIEQVTAMKPVLLLDDVLSELDKDRQKALLSSFNGHQTFITSTDIDEHIASSTNPQIINLAS